MYPHLSYRENAIEEMTYLSSVQDLHMSYHEIQVGLSSIINLLYSNVIQTDADTNHSFLLHRIRYPTIGHGQG